MSWWFQPLAGAPLLLGGGNTLAATEGGPDSASISGTVSGGGAATGQLNLLTQDGGTTNISDAVTASVTITAGRPAFVVFVGVGDLATSGDPHSISGAGQTWTEIYSAPVAGDDSAYTRCSIWTSPATSGGSGALTITTPDLSAWAWAVVEFEPSSGATATLGTEVEATTAENATSNSISLTSADYWVALSGVSKASGYGSLTATPRTDWTEVAEAVGLDSGWLGGIHAQLSPLDGDTDASVTWSQNVNIVLVAVPVTLTGGSSGASGSLAATEAGGDTAALTGSVLVEGALATTEAGSDSAAFAGSVPVQGDLDATEAGSDTAAFTGTAVVTTTGSLAATEAGSDIAALVGNVPVSGALAASETGTDSSAISGDVLVQGDLAATEAGSDTAAFSGVAPAAATGSLAATETGPDVAALTGSVQVTGSLQAAEVGSDVAAVAGTVPLRGTMAAVEVGSDSAAISGTSPAAILGTLAATEVGSDIAALIGLVPVTGAMAVADAGADVAAVSGAVLVSGSLSASEATPDSAAAVGHVRVTGALAAAEGGSDTAALVGGVATLLPGRAAFPADSRNGGALASSQTGGAVLRPWNGGELTTSGRAGRVLSGPNGGTLIEG